MVAKYTDFGLLNREFVSAQPLTRRATFLKSKPRLALRTP
jgi:hypothetical protein